MKPIICDIYNGTKFYNIDKNIIRVSILFDDTDNEPRIYDVPLLSTGSFKTPDFRYNKVLVFMPEGIEKKISIKDPENTEIGALNAVIPLGILIDTSQYKKLMGTIGNSAFHGDSDVGNQNIDELDFFIPTGFNRQKMMGDINEKTTIVVGDKEFPEPRDPENEDMMICGIGGAKDGSVFMRGSAGEVSIGPNGLRITGKVTMVDACPEKTDITQEGMTLFELIPKTIVTPFPNQLPNIQKIASIANIFAGVGKISAKLTKDFT